jgi:predicted Zn-dependent protease
VLLARAAAGEGDVAALRAQALAEFERELTVDPTNANAAYEAGELERRADRLSQARTFFETALRHYPEFDEALVGLGRVLVASGAPKDAVAPLQKATTINPQNEVAFYQLATAYRALGQADAQAQALAAFQRLRQARATAREIVPRSAPPVTPQTVDTKPVP